jgi:hypothetical protein
LPHFSTATILIYISQIGGPFSKDGAIGSQFDAAKDGIAGQVEKAVDGPSRPATEKK